jgi:hypothetical protein
VALHLLLLMLLLMVLLYLLTCQPQLLLRTGLGPVFRIANPTAEEDKGKISENKSY